MLKYARVVLIGSLVGVFLLLSGCQSKSNTANHRFNVKKLPRRNATTFDMATGHHLDYDLPVLKKKSFLDRYDQTFALPEKKEEIVDQFKIHRPEEEPVLAIKQAEAPKAPAPSQKQVSAPDPSTFTKKDVQGLLKKLGYYNGPIDGVYGKGTRKAIISFQRAAGLKIDGIAGKNTKYALAKASVSRGSSNLDVQLHLKKLGYYNGPLDGIIGKGTKNAVKAFQRDHGLKVDGIPGRNTKAKLLASQ